MSEHETALDDLDDLPLLTEVVQTDTGALPDVAVASPPLALDEAAYQQLLMRLENHFSLRTEALAPPLPVLSEALYEQLVDRLEDHLENLLNQKLTLHLTRMKAQIAEQVMEEIRQDSSTIPLMQEL